FLTGVGDADTAAAFSCFETASRNIRRFDRLSPHLSSPLRWNEQCFGPSCFLWLNSSLVPLPISRTVVSAVLLAIASALLADHFEIHTEQNPKAASESKSSTESPIRFAFQPIDFKLDSNESAER